MPRISIVIPVHNVDRYITECLDSVLSQSLHDIEVICVDDCSTDGSAGILAERARQDDRLRVISFTQNKSASQARKDGALAATGEYVLFVDADDTIEHGALERLDTEMRRNPVDILHFGATIINEGNLPAVRIAQMSEFLSPHEGTLHAEQVIRGAFSKPRVYNFTLWDKMYSAELCRQAFSRIKDGSFPKAQDKYAYFVLSYFARTYRGVPQIKAYNYHFGRGVTGHNTLTLTGFERYCSMALVADAVDEFLREEEAEDRFRAEAESVRHALLGDCVANWTRHVAPEDAAHAFDLMVAAWGAPGVVGALAQLNRHQCGVLARRVREARSLEASSRPVRTVATYYHRFANGGVQRVLSLLIQLWRDLGYEVVLVTEEPPSDDDYELPEGVRRVTIPKCPNATREEYEDRARALSAVLIENDVDAVVYHAWASRLMVWDLLVCKMSGVHFHIHCHSVFSQPARSANDYFADMPPVYSLADGVVTLSDADRAYWSSFNANVATVVNPLSFDPALMPMADLKGKTVLWLGRLSNEKRPRDALKIFARVLEQEPDARMEMVGSSPDAKYVMRLQELAKDLGVDEAVSFRGFHRDVTQFYERASVLLMTSEYEGFSMVLTESQSSGLPCVMYELPYLTVVRTGRGVVAVEMGNIDRAADAIVDLLADHDLRLKLGRDARANVEDLAAFDFQGAWRKVLEGSSSPQGQPTTEADTVMWETLLSHYRIGARARAAEVAKLKAEVAFGAGFEGALRRMRRKLRHESKRLGKQKGSRRFRDAAGSWISSIMGRFGSRRPRFTEAEIVSILAQTAVDESAIRALCRQHGIDEQTYYLWRRKYSEILTSEMVRMRELEEENARLKRMLAERELEIVAIKGEASPTAGER